MKEKITNGVTITADIDRETGEIDILDHRFKLNIQENRANLFEIENSKEILSCAGYQFKGSWYFSEHERSQKDQDPFMAVIKLLYDVLPH